MIPSRTVYEYGVPDGPLPLRYLVVRGNEGGEESSTVADARDLRSPAVWVTSVSRNADPALAAREASWGAGRARDALRGWRPPLGRAAWKLASELSQPASRDESIPETTFFAVEQFSALHQA